MSGIGWTGVDDATTELPEEGGSGGLVVTAGGPGWLPALSPRSSNSDELPR